jgi:hypothetical protein
MKKGINQNKLKKNQLKLSKKKLKPIFKNLILGLREKIKKTD